jgi:hypothetical protein
MRGKKKGPAPEYRLSVVPAGGDLSSHGGTLVVLRTATSFANFRYTLSVEERREGNTIHLKVLGLRPPSLDLPSSGPAEFTREYEGLHGRYRIVVEGLDGSKISKTIDIP